jgi:hypothetical protein
MAAPNRRIKAPKVFQGTPGKAKRFARSSTKQPKPQGTDPSNPAYGILHGGNQSVEVTAAKAARMFGNGSANTSNQAQLARKARRQVGG